MQKEKLIDLIEAFDEYSQAHVGDIDDFARWLLDADQKRIMREEDESKNRRLSWLIYRMNRINKQYSRSVFKNLKISTIEEFMLLNSIYHHPDIGKNELYQTTLVEINTGTQTIKRFGRLGLIKEKNSPSDRRITMLSLTEEGKEERQKAFNQLDRNIQFQMSCLDSDEKAIFYRLLSKYNQFHTYILNTEKKLDTEGLIKKYIGAADAI